MATELRCTIGELLDELAAIQSHEFQFWINDAQMEVQPEEWHRARDSRDLEMLCQVIQVVVGVIQYEVGQWSKPEPYQRSIQRGHEFLREVARLAQEKGVQVPVEIIEQPLSFADAMIGAGLVERVGSDRVKLTPAGEAAAAEVQRAIDAVRDEKK